MIDPYAHDDDFLEQSKWILNQNITTPKCPLVSNCRKCVVYYYENLPKFTCRYTDKIKGAKNYLNFIRNEKLKKINK